MTVRDFYIMLFGDFEPSKFTMYLGDHISFGKAAEMPLERRLAAYMSYVYITEVKNETDEPSIEPAFILKDIYECSSCIRYIAQVYLKGIMLAPDGLFGVRRLMDKEEAEKTVQRVKDRSKRFMSL